MSLRDFFRGLSADQRRIRAEQERLYAGWREQKRLRIADLLADPAKAKYAALVEQGQEWSDAHIAYFENHLTTATCPHLEPIERAMRQQGVVTKLGRQDLILEAACRVDEAALQTQFNLAGPLQFQTGYMPERHPEDNPWAAIACSQCKWRIIVIPDQEATANTPTFPAA